MKASRRAAPRRLLRLTGEGGVSRGAGIAGGVAILLAIFVGMEMHHRAMERESTSGRMAAGNLVRRAVELDRDAGERVDPALLDLLATLEHGNGDLAAAESSYREALREREQELGPEHPAVAESYNKLGRLLKDSGQYEEAETCYDRALAIRRSSLDPQHPDLAASLNNLGRLREARGEYAGAIELYDEALTIWRASLDEEHWIPAQVMSNRGVCLMRLGRMAEAGEALRESHRQLVRSLGPQHPRVATSIDRQAAWLEAQGRHEEAHHLREELRSAAEKKIGDLMAVRSSLLRTDL